MVYKLLDTTLPKFIRDKLAKGGADFSDYFPLKTNTKTTSNFLRGTLGLLHDIPPPTDQDLLRPHLKRVPVKKDDAKHASELEGRIF